MDNRRFWTRFARYYDPFMRRFSPDYPALARRISRDLKDASAVLDIATGTGLIATALARPDRRVIGLDLALTMVTVTGAKARNQGLSGLYVNVGSATMLPYPDKTFDGVVCANALHVMSHPDVALREMRRVLIPGGTLILPTYCHAETQRAQLVSRVMHLFGFKAYTRFTAASLAAMVSDHRFAVVQSDMSEDSIPLCYLVARPAQH